MALVPLQSTLTLTRAEPILFLVHRRRTQIDGQPPGTPNSVWWEQPKFY
uniref:Uncharacterized protein n=1 Tax=Arundo donax TaxID=35708 RepID=A0A0A8Z8Q1_ARUDO